MSAVGAVMALAAIAVHGLVELAQDGKLVAGIFLADLEVVGFAEIGFGEGIAMVAAGGDTDRHGFFDLV